MFGFADRVQSASTQPPPPQKRVGKSLGVMGAEDVYAVIKGAGPHLAAYGYDVRIAIVDHNLLHCCVVSRY